MDLLSEGEQWEAIKAWLRENGLAIAAGLLLGGMALGGWKWWQAHQDSQRLAANGAYENLLRSFDAGDIAAAERQLEQFQRDFGGSAYAAPADLAAARVYVARNDLDKAATRLRNVEATSRDEQLRVIARLRLARVQIAQGKPDDALATLGSASEGSFQSGFAEVRGDALFAKGDRAGALREYLAARSARSAGGQSGGLDGADLLDLKLNDLRPAAAAAAAGPKG